MAGTDDVQLGLSFGEQPVMHEHSPEHARYLGLAQDAFATADGMSSPDAREEMRRIGRGYLAMAQFAEKRERTITAAPRRSGSRCPS